MSTVLRVKRGNSSELPDQAGRVSLFLLFAYVLGRDWPLWYNLPLGWDTERGALCWSSMAPWLL